MSTKSITIPAMPVKKFAHLLAFLRTLPAPVKGLEAETLGMAIAASDALYEKEKRKKGGE